MFLASPWRVGGLTAAAYVAAHLPSLAPSLEDIDSINFALGLHEFDPARHHPHPPGYPVYMVLGRAVLACVAAVWPAAGSVTADALALAVVSVISAAVAIVAAAHLFARLALSRATETLPRVTEKTPTTQRPMSVLFAGSARARPPGPTIWATALLAGAPLFWMSGLRPMSDMSGLAAALVAQALALHGCADRRRLTLAGVMSGVAAGIRVQTVWLTLPLVAIALIAQRRAGWRWLLSRPIAALAAGGLAWAVPLVVASGGPTAYVAALGSQAGEDFAWVGMLWLEPTPRRLAFAVYETFVLPWGSIALASVVAAAAMAGAAAMLVRERGPLLLLLAAYGPYIVFHLLFQETLTVRYALPTLPVVVWLAVRGLSTFGRFAPLAPAPLMAGALLVAVPAGVAYGQEAHPAFRAIADAARHALIAPPAAVYAHFSLWRALQAERGGLPAVAPRRQYEWLGPVEYWKSGGSAPIWFLADPRRTDLALIDPHSRRDVVQYRWRVAQRLELSGTRPIGADWYRLQPPGWFAGEGWSLTPETGGLARASAAGPDRRPIEVWVRRRPGPLHIVVGGRHLGARGDPPAEFELAVDGRVRDRWTLTVDQRNFLRFLDLPQGLASDTAGYARLTIASRPQAPNGRRAEVGVRQFDIQPAAQMVYGFGEGWHEEEYDPVTGRRWRWTSERSVLHVKGPAQPVRLTVRGESPMRYFDAPPTLRVTAAGRVVAELRPDADFAWTVSVPAEDVTRAGGAIALEVDRVYLPGVAEGTSDDRRLGLRLFECGVHPVSP